MQDLLVDGCFLRSSSPDFAFAQAIREIELGYPPTFARGLALERIVSILC